MQTMYILIGLIGSGKSTWARKKAESEKNTIIINGDSFRSMIKGGGYIFDMTYEPFVKKMTRIAVKTALAMGFNVIVDETNLTKDKRKSWINLAESWQDWGSSDVQVHFVYFSEKDNNVENRMNDHRGLAKEVWQSVYNRMKIIFEEPDFENELPKNGSFEIINIKN